MGRILRAVVVFALVAVAGRRESEAQDAAGLEFFEKRIRPLLVEKCSECHGRQKQESGLVLGDMAAIRKGGDRGPALVPGEPDQSLLIQAVRYTDEDLKMPPRGKLKDEQIADLVAWIKMGAPGPQESQPFVVKPSSDFNLAERRRHWAYQPIEHAALPPVKSAGWLASPIDAFVLARLEAAGLSPAAPAENRTLIRRLTFDLTGLPPAESDVAAFLADSAPDAYERLIDRLLASPRYGERWGRHWLDVVRYSETLGFEFDYDLHHAWRYRDYVIRAMNSDLPYDQFVIEHLAGDLAPAPRRGLDGANESVLATGFFWMCEGKQTPVDIRQEQADRIDNQIDTLGKAFLAQTIACARCHDHKFDAISTRDYYALAGYLKSSRYQQAFIDAPERIALKLEELAALKTKIRERAADEVSQGWLAQLAMASRYLLAAAKPKSEDRQAESGLNSARLEAWTKALAHESAREIDHPLYAWSMLAKERPNAAEQLETLRKTLSEAQAAANRAMSAAQPFETFGQTAFDAWYVTGAAFDSGPARRGDFAVGENVERPVARLANGGADSGLASLKLQGELRSRSFTIDKPYLHVRLSGRNTRVNLVIDGNTLIMNPMYGKLTTGPQGTQPAWRTMPVERWLGRRAYIEASDCTIPMHRLNPPPSTARMPEGPGEGYVAVEQIVFSDGANPPAAPSRVSIAVFAEAANRDSLETRAAAYQDQMMRAVTRWRSGELATAPEGGDEIRLINWLLENGLLDGPPNNGSGDLAGLLKRYQELEAALPKPDRAPALADGTGEDEFVFLRGNYKALGERAVRGPPEVMQVSLQPGSASETALFREATSDNAGSGRLELARRLASPENPLVGRVIANRLWQHHFGEGLVRTPDDFGRMGQAPSHPALLDHLAAELVRGRWSLKALHRRMVASSVYRMSSNSEFGMRKAESREASRLPSIPRSELRAPSLVDPENRLLHRMPIRRLEAEAIRDSILAVSGRLGSTMHGPSVLPFLTPYMEGRGRPASGPLDGEGRRAIYINARRNFLTPLLLAFDYPVTFTTIGRRGTATIPAQALSLMNDPFVVQEAERWGGRVLADGASTSEERIAALYQTAFARPPTAAEVQRGLEFLEHQAIRHGGESDDPRAWADLCHVLLNVKEFIFVE